MKNLPLLVTFDGEARSGKGTIVQATKDYLKDSCKYTVMLIDAGQLFRVLVVATTRNGVDVDSPQEIDNFLADDANTELCVDLVKQVYRMTKEERDALMYTNEVGANSAKIGARPLSQAFKDSMLRKWFRDAGNEGYQVVLLDGRALEETGQMLESEGICQFICGFYFVCDGIVGARRTLGFADRSYDSLTVEEKQSVDMLVVQIDARNAADRERKVQPIVPPSAAKTYCLPDIPADSTISQTKRPMLIVDTSAEIAKEVMPIPVAHFTASVLNNL